MRTTKKPTAKSRTRPNAAEERAAHVVGEELRFIDLFCGCGGFTLGMERAGLRCLAAVDVDPVAVATLRANLPSVSNVLQRDLIAFSPEELADVTGVRHVDVIVGGPPCQGFSTVRQVDGANHGERLKDDPRRYLYREFLRYVAFFQPRVFVMENVLGLRSAAGGEYFTAVQKEARELGRAEGRLGYRVHGQVEDAWELGVPQKRRRQLIVGVRGDLPGYFIPKLRPTARAVPQTNLGPAICDLPKLRAGEGKDERDYDDARRVEHLRIFGEAARNYLYRVVEVDRAELLTNHIARQHSDRDLRDFARLREGESSAVAMRRGVEFEFPYNKEHFKDRYTRQSRRAPCSTIVAHLSKDGLMFIHPTQNRSLTPREAARVQTFPDWFRFPAARTHAFRLIGNAVPPLLAEAVGISVISHIESLTAINKGTHASRTGMPIPKDETEAFKWLEPLIDCDRRALRRVPRSEFNKAWSAIAFLYPGLHPAGALESGRISIDTEDYLTGTTAEPRLTKPFYEQSGWPLVLVPVVEEAWRRHISDELGKDEFYCVEAQRSGLDRRAYRSAV